MRIVPDWLIQTCWWVSSIFATGAVWYFVSTREYCLAVAAGVSALAFAIIAIVLHRKKDTQQTLPSVQAVLEEDKLVTSNWWEASDLRKEYVGRGLSLFRWSNGDRVAERQQEGYEVVILKEPEANKRFRLVNKSGQVLVARAADS